MLRDTLLKPSLCTNSLLFRHLWTFAGRIFSLRISLPICWQHIFTQPIFSAWIQTESSFSLYSKFFSPSFFVFVEFLVLHNCGCKLYWDSHCLVLYVLWAFWANCIFLHWMLLLWALRHITHRLDSRSHILNKSCLQQHHWDVLIIVCNILHYLVIIFNSLHFNTWIVERTSNKRTLTNATLTAIIIIHKWMSSKANHICTKLRSEFSQINPLICGVLYWKEGWWRGKNRPKMGKWEYNPDHYCGSLTITVHYVTRWDVARGKST